MRYLILFVTVVTVFLMLAVSYADYNESYRKLPESFRKEFLMTPWAGTLRQVSSCIECHVSGKMRAEIRDIPDQWRRSWHFQNNVGCSSCHGGDPDDVSMAMSHKRGFVGSPKRQDLPEFCGRCHIGILDNYLASGHGKVFEATGEGPNCIDCHGSHNIKKANIDIINEYLCTKCHGFDRARLMRQALFAVENQIDRIETKLNNLKGIGVVRGDIERAFFSTQAEFRTLFHTIDVDLIRQRTNEFSGRMTGIEDQVQEVYTMLDFRRNYAAFLFLLFLGLTVTVYKYSRSVTNYDLEKEKKQEKQD